MLPPLVKWLIVANFAAFFAQGALGEQLLVWFALWPGDPAGLLSAPWTLLSYGFLHAGVTHLLFNMFALWMFGGPLEATWGSRRFLQYYLVCVVGAGAVQLVVATAAASGGLGPYPTVGASGGVFGLLLAYGLLFPNHRLMLLFPPIPMRARTFVICYGLLELFLGVTGTASGVAHFAHLGGMAFGFLLIQFWRGRWPFRRTRR